MLNRVYRLIEKKKITKVFIEERVTEDNIFVRPTYLSICAADQRYYNFNRPAEVLEKKLPMALIHEAIGEVVYDPKGEYNCGEKVILLPNIPMEKDDIIEENYLRTSLFKSSGHDGFLQETINQPRERVVTLPEELHNETMSFAELMSVAIHAIRRFSERAHSRRRIIGVWGDGNLGLITSLFLKNTFPDNEIYVFGKTQNKLDLFSFADKTFLVNDELSKIHIDHAFECVGGIGTQYAMNQIIDIINPEGYIAMMGVSEKNVELNTRMCLEKGLNLVGNSRSTKADYQEVVKILTENESLLGYLETLIASVQNINSVPDIEKAFEIDASKNFGKTVLKWNI